MRMPVAPRLSGSKDMFDAKDRLAVAKSVRDPVVAGSCRYDRSIRSLWVAGRGRSDAELQGQGGSRHNSQTSGTIVHSFDSDMLASSPCRHNIVDSFSHSSEYRMPGVQGCPMMSCRGSS